MYDIKFNLNKKKYKKSIFDIFNQYYLDKPINKSSNNNINKIQNNNINDNKIINDINLNEVNINLQNDTTENSNTIDDTKICFITAIYGNYESSCKKFVEQTIKTDFICFTDNPNIINNNWIIDTTPYHIINKSNLDNNEMINSICNNKHTFNIAKYYKQQHYLIPILKKYEVVVWIDGTIEIIYNRFTEFILNNIYKHKIIGWCHNVRNGFLYEEVKASDMYRYTSTFWNGQHQPFQNIYKQYSDYIENGYDETFFKSFKYNDKHYGIWLTCFIVFLNTDIDVINFLNLWYLQTLKYTTQDQISFPYIVQKTKLLPFTISNNENKYILNDKYTNINTKLYIKHEHGL